MKLIATMPARNEDWVIGLSARAVLRWCDELVVLDHASFDGTADIIAGVADEYAGRVTVLRDLDPTWREMAHRQRLLATARERGATHIAVVDADEVITSNLLQLLRGWVAQPGERSMVTLQQLVLRDSIAMYESSGLWSQQWTPIAFTDTECAYWAAKNGYDFHQRAPLGCNWTMRRFGRHMGGVMHLQFCNRRRLLAKQALYKLTEVIRWPGRDTMATINQRYDWSVYGDRKGTPTTTACDPSWWAGYADLMRYLKPDGEPWQEAECRRIVEAHGRAKFAGLDLFGVV